MKFRAPIAACVAVLSAFAGSCSSGAQGGRRIALVSPDREVDQALRTARESALEGNLDRADTALRSVLDHHPADPVCPLARVMLARVTLARGDIPHAVEMARTANVSIDPALARSDRLVLGIAAAREGHDDEALRLLRPLEGQLPDRAETAELSCALAEAESRHGDPVRALRAMATVEQVRNDSGSWVPTGLSCEQPNTREALVEHVAASVHDPRALAGIIDALPAESPLRRPVELQLRTLAESTHTLSQWLTHLGDLPDDEASQPSVLADRGPQLVVGVLAPLSGTRSSIGLSILRGAQFGLESDDNVRSIPEDEGESPADAVAALDRLAAQGARIVIGVSREDSSAAVAIRAQALGIELWLLVPTRGVDGAGPHVHIAGPLVDARARALIDAAHGRSDHATLMVPSEPTEIHERLRDGLVRAGLPTTSTHVDDLGNGVEASSGVRVVAGTFGREARASMGRAAEHAANLWVFEARSAPPGAAGTWVGVRAGPGFAHVLDLFCTRAGEPPDELALLAFEAARSAVAFARNNPMPERALAEGLPLTSATLTTSARIVPDAPAASARCPAEETAH